MPVQVLDAPVPQVGEVRVVEFMRKFDAPVVAEPVIEVPKISLDKVPRHRMVDVAHATADGGTAGACADDHLVLFFAADCRADPLTFQFPRVRGGRWRRSSRFSPWTRGALQQRTWSRSLIFQFLSVVGGELVVFKVLSLDRVQQRIWSRSLVFLHVEVLQVFSPGQSSSSSSRLLVNADEGIQGDFFALFSVPEKVRGWVRTRGRN